MDKVHVCKTCCRTRDMLPHVNPWVQFTHSNGLIQGLSWYAHIQSFMSVFTIFRPTWQILPSVRLFFYVELLDYFFSLYSIQLNNTFLPTYLTWPRAENVKQKYNWGWPKWDIQNGAHFTLVHYIVITRKGNIYHLLETDFLSKCRSHRPYAFSYFSWGIPLFTTSLV